MELGACTHVARVDTTFEMIEDKLLAESRASFKTGVADTKELEAYRLTAIFVAQSLAKHKGVALYKEVIKSHESTVAPPLKLIRTHKDCTLNLMEYQYSVFLNL